MITTSTKSDSSYLAAGAHLFLGGAPRWYKLAILSFLVLNPAIFFIFGPFVAGWALLSEFILALALALKCYPLQPGGLLAIEAMALGLTSPEAAYHEAEQNFSVILLLIFMVAGIYFMRELLGTAFAGLFTRVRRKDVLALVFCGASAILSAFLDALTVMAVVIAVALGLHDVYHRAVSMTNAPAGLRDDAEEFLAFLRSIVMHAAVGTALGGVCTLVGEPQNLLIGHSVGWSFGDFLIRVAPVSMPVLAAGLIVCVLLEKLRVFGYGSQLPPAVREILIAHSEGRAGARDAKARLQIWIQGFAALLLVAGLALHVAEVGMLGLGVIIFITAFCGIIDEKRIGHAFEDALPFTALLVVFFVVVAVIQTQELFRPVIDFVLAHDGRTQLVLMYAANGLLSAISDNVFVATVYVNAAKAALDSGAIDRQQFELLAVAINTGTNIPSVATPNGQAAFLFLLTSALSPLIKLGYGRMLWMALPYTVVMTVTGLAAVWLFL